VPRAWKVRIATAAEIGCTAGDRTVQLISRDVDPDEHDWRPGGAVPLPAPVLHPLACAALAAALDRPVQDVEGLASGRLLLVRDTGSTGRPGGSLAATAEVFDAHADDPGLAMADGVQALTLLADGLAPDRRPAATALLEAAALRAVPVAPVATRGPGSCWPDLDLHYNALLYRVERLEAMSRSQAPDGLLVEFRVPVAEAVYKLFDQRFTPPDPLARRSEKRQSLVDHLATELGADAAGALIASPDVVDGVKIEAPDTPRVRALFAAAALHAEPID
jgi:hypothetical protein